ncbi:MAG: hypothetical protein M3179_08155 [Actinomycetota bacterium]|nr:hypothetical protein [Actinomycetota bacterium]
MLPETDFSQWFYVFAPLQIYLIIVMTLLVYGQPGHSSNIIREFFYRISNSLERATGYPGWAMACGLTGLLMLGTAAIGLYWDVGYHVNYGRDQQLFTPSHTMIVIGLGGLAFAGIIGIVFASLDRAPVGFSVGPVRIPWSALAITAMGIGGVAAFPLDAMWHEAYGIDVTLWSPSHLQLLGGGGLATITLWLMLREAGPARPTLLGRVIRTTYFGAVLTGLTIFQGEFDFGVPQFQVLYLPILIALAGAFTLVLARVAMGPWGAVKTVFAFVIIRSAIALLVGGPFNMTVPVFPLYAVAALSIEGVAYVLGTRQRLRFALVGGLVAGTVGVASDMVWLSALHDVTPTTNGLAKAALFALLAGVAAGVLGGALSRPVAGTGVPGLVAGVAGVVVLGVLWYPLPRNVGDVRATVRLTPVGDRATVEVQLDPPDAADSATAFGLMSWQGGGQVGAAMDEIGPGLYRSSRPVPVTGTWKSVVGLQRGDEVMAVPVYLPADPEIGAPEIPAVPERTERFVRNTKLLLREQRPGDQDVAMLAYGGLALIVAIWIGLFSLAAAKAPVLDDDEDLPEAQPHTPASSPAGASATAASVAATPGNGWYSNGEREAVPSANRHQT